MEFQREYIVTATIRPIEEEAEFTDVVKCLSALGEDTAAVLAGFREAAPSPVVNGRPRMLHVSAWIVHEDENDNGDAFIAEELQQAVETGSLFSDAYAGIIDFNHDLQPKGYWYKSEYAFDPTAGESGKWGVLAHGAIWAWLFGDLTDEMLVIQTREGGIKVSMMVLTNRIERVKSNDRIKNIIHDPVFVGASVLNQRPGDPHADGIVAEDPSDSDLEQRRQHLMAATFEEDTQMEDILKDIQAALPQVSEEIVARLTAAFTAQAEQVRSEMAQHVARNAELTNEVEQAQSRIAELDALVAERDIALETARAENATLTARVTELETEASARAEADAAREEATRLDARISELPETVRERFATRPQTTQDQLKARWAKLSNDEWAVVKEELSIGAENPRVGRLPNFTTSRTSGTGRINLDQHIKVLHN